MKLTHEARGTFAIAPTPFHDDGRVDDSSNDTLGEPGREKIAALRRFQKDGSLRPSSILLGDIRLVLEFEMERGAGGAMTGYAFPEMLLDVGRLSMESSRAAGRAVRARMGRRRW